MFLKIPLTVRVRGILNSKKQGLRRRGNVLYCVGGAFMHLEDKKKSLLLFWTVFFLYVLVYMTKNCFSAAMASIVDAGVLSKSQTGLITAVFYIVYTLQVVGGMVADRFKPDLLIKIGLIGGGIANAIIFFNQNYIVILVTWVFNAIIQFAVWPGVFKIISSQLIPEQRSRAAFFMSFSSTLGLMVAYIVAAMVRRWEDNFLISSVVLFLLTVVFHIITKRVEPYMVPDTVPRGVHSDKPLQIARHGMSTGKILLMGGICFVVVSYLLRAMLENGIKTLSATMLMESYEQVTPAIGNLLNTLVILSGMLGTLAVRFGLSRLIKDEIVGTALLLALCFPFIILLHFVGRYNVWIAVIALCIVVAALTGTYYLLLSYTMHFTRYGLSGTVAGITNAAASFGIVIQSYGFTKLAEMTDWNTVADLWLGLVAVSALLLVIALPTWKRFKALERQEETV